MTPSNMTGDIYNHDLKKMKDGVTIANPRFRIVLTNWDMRCKDQIATGVGFRIIEKGKTDLDIEPGKYSIHSPLYGTDWKDADAFEDQYSCECGKYTGARYMTKGFVCEKCGKPVQFIDTDLRKTGWFILDRDTIIHPGLYKQLESFLTKQHLNQMLKFVPESERSRYMDEKTSPFYGIGMIEFKERFDEIIQYFYARNKKHDAYNHIRIFKPEIFCHSIPCFNKNLRQWTIRNGDIKYSDEDILFQQIFSDHILLNDDVEWKRRVDYRIGKKKNASYLRKENILYRLQGYVNQMWDLTFKSINEKEGIINEQILGGRLNYIARNVIIPDPMLKIDEISLGYTTFLKLYSAEMSALLRKMYGISFGEADERVAASMNVFDKDMYRLMMYLITQTRVYMSIGRNPSIDFGSYDSMKLAKIEPSNTEYCMAIPPYVNTKFNSDYDGDIMFIVNHKLGKIGERYYQKNNPRSTMCVSHNDGLYDTETGLYKDSIALLYAFLNI